MNVLKEARRDAEEYAFSQMYYGEGAGNKRKLIAATVAAKALRNPGYKREFDRAYARQDMAKHAEAATKVRRRTDAIHAVNKNVKAAATGNYGGVNAAVLVVGIAAFYAHKTGFDKKVVNKVKEKAHDVKMWREKKRADRAAKVHHNVTTIPRQQAQAR